MALIQVSELWPGVAPAVQQAHHAYTHQCEASSANGPNDGIVPRKQSSPGVLAVRWYARSPASGDTTSKDFSTRGACTQGHEGTERHRENSRNAPAVTQLTTPHNIVRVHHAHSHRCSSSVR